MPRSESAAEPGVAAARMPSVERWLEQTSERRYHPAPLEREEREPLAQRLRRAVGAPFAIGAVVFVLAIIVAILISFMNRPGAETEGSGAAGAPGSVTEGVRDPAAEAGEPAGVASPEAGEAADVIFAHVVGEIGAPGVVELPHGARVADAIAAAGGATDGAALAGVNLARPVTDGEQIVVPSALEGLGGSGEGLPPVEQLPGQPSVIRLNTADAAELEQLPRIGPAIAARIIEWRTQNGPFASVDALLDVPGIGPKTLDGFRELVSP